NRLRPVYFQHLRKTGGTSLVDTLKLFFRPERCALVDERLQSGDPTEDVLNQIRACDLVTGHSEILSSAPPGAFKVAVFRDPLLGWTPERRKGTQAPPQDFPASPPAVAAATVALQKRPFVEILQRAFDYPVMLPDFWNHQTMILGAWPLLKKQTRQRRAS